MKVILVTALLFLSSFADFDTLMKSSDYYPVTLKKNLFGEYIVHAEVNSKSFEMMVSLNIEQTIIDKVLAEKYEFEVELIEGREFQLNTDKSDMYSVKVDEFKIGDVVSNESEIGAINFKDFSYLKQLRVEGILGKSFLKYNNAVLDIATEKLYLKK